MSKLYELEPTDKNDTEFWAIKIKDEESNYNDLQVLYGGVSMKVIDEEHARLSFDYDIIDNPWQVDINEDELRDILGSALEDIIADAFESESYRIGSDESRTGNNP